MVQGSVCSAQKALLRQDRRDGAEVLKPQVRLRRIEDLKRDTHPAEKGRRQIAIFEMASNESQLDADL